MRKPLPAIGSLRIVTYNTNCLLSSTEKATARTYITDTMEFLAQQHIVLLQELGSSDALSTAAKLMPMHNFYATSHQRLRKGYGVEAAIRKDIAHTLTSYHIHSEHQIVHLHLGIAPHDIHIFSCYIPHEASKQLQAIDLIARHSFLQQQIEDISSKHPAALIIAAGDFNAKVGQEQALGPQALTAINSHNAGAAMVAALPIHTSRTQLHPQLDQPGTLLNALCHATNLINLTGATPLPCPPTSAPAPKPDPESIISWSPAAASHTSHNMQCFTGCKALITDLSFSISACCPTSAKQRKPPAKIVYTSSLYLRQNRQWCSNTSTLFVTPAHGMSMMSCATVIRPILHSCNMFFRGHFSWQPSRLAIVSV
jgi:exonuclease III